MRARKYFYHKVIPWYSVLLLHSVWYRARLEKLFKSYFEWFKNWWWVSLETILRQYFTKLVAQGVNGKEPVLWNKHGLVMSTSNWNPPALLSDWTQVAFDPFTGSSTADLFGVKFCYLYFGNNSPCFRVILRLKINETA